MTVSTPKSRARRRSIAFLVVGAALIAVSQGRVAIPLAALLAPIFLVRFFRTTPVLAALPAFVLAHIAAWKLAYLGMMPMPTGASIGLFAGLALVLAVVFLADRWASRRSGSFLVTLVLPSGWAAYEYAIGAFSPTGSWGSLAYTFTDTLALAQVASITGWTGLAFLAVWPASVVNWAWERRERGEAARRGLVTAAAVYTVVIGLGAARLETAPTNGPIVRVACVAAPSTFQGDDFEALWKYTRGVETTDDEAEAARRKIAVSRERHFSLVERGIRAGAHLVTWPEANPSLTAAEEPAWIAQGRELARRESVYIGMGLFVFRPQQGLPTQNKFVLVGPDGSIVWEFLKATRVPGSSHVVGDGRLPRADTEFGRWSSAICFDLDFPRLLAQAGRMDAGIVLGPSNDWREVRSTHARMAVMRAIEQGFVLVRPTKDGITLIADPYGRRLAQVDGIDEVDVVLVANAPIHGVKTVYSRIGDAFSWACCAIFFAAPVLVRVRRAPAERRDSPQ